MTSFHRLLSLLPDPEPVPAGPVLTVPDVGSRIQVVLFDVYGTLVASKLGDLDQQLRRERERESFVDTARHFGFSDEVGLRWADRFYRDVEEDHEGCRRLGIQRGEVLVEVIWARLLEEAGGPPPGVTAHDAALYRELAANPVAAFSGTSKTLLELKQRGFRLGLVSNAQFYTIPILERRLGIPLQQVFDSGWTFLSYRLGFAKPDPHFFRLVKTTALRKGYTPDAVLVVGNDPTNDVEASELHGLKAVLFAPGHRSEASGRPVIQNLEVLPDALAR
jgi:putative hydrolase of the HAD superfamily